MTTECKHEQTRYEDWPDGGEIEICKECGQSRHHSEVSESPWIMVEDIEECRRSVRESLRNLHGDRYAADHS